MGQIILQRQKLVRGAMPILNFCSTALAALLALLSGNQLKITLDTLFISNYELIYKKELETPIDNELLKSYKQKLISNPREIVAENYDISRELDALFCQFKESNKTLSDYRSLLNKCISDYPLSLFYECAGFECSLSRFLFPKRRAWFEKMVVESLVEQSKKSDLPINYVNLGSGGLFQDILIITQALEQGVKKLNIHCVDPLYKQFISTLKAKSLNKSDLDFGAEEFEATYGRFKSFFRWVSSVYPASEIRVFIYSFAEDYIKVAQKNLEFLADIVVVADPEPYKKNDCTSEETAWNFSSYSNMVKDSGVGFMLLKGGTEEEPLATCTTIKVLPKKNTCVTGLLSEDVKRNTLANYFYE